jgi:type II secretory pathway component GspD/PulD (secretin)
MLGLAACTARAQESDQPVRLPARQPETARTVEKPEPRAVRPSPVRASTPQPAADAPNPPGSAHNSPEAVPVVLSQDGEQRHARVVQHLKAVPAVDLANTMVGLLRAEGRQSASHRSVVIVPDKISNSLVISGPPDAVDEVQKLAEQLDHRAVMVRVELVLVDVPFGGKGGVPKPDAKRTAALRAEALRPDALPEQSEILARAELTTLENQSAFLRMGRREPRVTGSNMSQAGMVNSVTFENVGTTIRITPRVGDDRTVVMQVDVEDSRPGPPEEGVVISVPAKGEPLRTPNVETLMTQTTVQIADGKTVSIGGSQDAKSGKQRMILITPHVLSMSEGH